MSMQGIYETSITLGEGDSALRPVLLRLCKERPDLIRSEAGSYGTSLFVERYILTDIGVVELARAVDKNLP